MVQVWGRGSTIPGQHLKARGDFGAPGDQSAITASDPAHHLLAGIFRCDPASLPDRCGSFISENTPALLHCRACNNGFPASVLGAGSWCGSARDLASGYDVSCSSNRRFELVRGRWSPRDERSDVHRADEGFDDGQRIDTGRNLAALGGASHDLAPSLEPFVTEFFIDYSDVSTLATPASPISRSRTLGRPAPLRGKPSAGSVTSP